MLLVDAMQLHFLAARTQVMTAQHAGNFLHGLESRTHGVRAPSVEELPSPVPRDVVPEDLEIRLQQVGSDRAQDAKVVDAIITNTPKLPEPTTLSLVGSALLVLAIGRRRRYGGSTQG